MAHRPTAEVWFHMMMRWCPYFRGHAPPSANRGVQSLISKSIWTRFGREFGLQFGASKTSKSDFNFDLISTDFTS
jgi:hypothetical protein